MITDNVDAILKTIDIIAEHKASHGDYFCPSCGMSGLSENALRAHNVMGGGLAWGCPSLSGASRDGGADSQNL